MSRLKSLILRLAVLALTPAAALAQPYEELTRTGEFGGPGGGYFELMCDPNEVLAGISVAAGKDLNAVAARCQSMANDRPTGQTRLTGIVGSGNGSSADALCTGDLVEGMEVETSHVDLVHRVVLVCRQFAGGHRRERLARTDFGGFLKGGEAARSELASCGGDSYAIGIYGKYGSNIDSLGLICGKSARIANPPPPLTTDPNGNGSGKKYIQTGKPKKPAAAVDNSDDTPEPAPANDGGNDGGGKTFRGTVNQPSAIYAEPDGAWIADLSPGDKVTITECKQEYENFCHVIKPKKGYVYEPELDY